VKVVFDQHMGMGLFERNLSLVIASKVFANFLNCLSDVDSQT
jgi:hypothetical protein